jgi:hypothetical protein
MDVIEWILYFDISHLLRICLGMLYNGMILEMSDSILDCAELRRTIKWPCLKFVRKVVTSCGAKIVNAGYDATENLHALCSAR